MKNKNIIIGLVIAAVVVGLFLIAKSTPPKKQLKPAAKASKAPAPVPVKKAISKGKGALTVKIVNSKKSELPLRIRAFRNIDAKTSVYESTFFANKIQELTPGTYDIEVDTLPQKIFKDLRVTEGKENTEDLGSITGAITIKALNAQGKSAYYPLRVLYSKSDNMVASSMTNRSTEILPGTYDVELGTSPRQIKKDLRVEAGKELSLDIGCITGTLNVKTLDQNKKEVRYSYKVTRADNNETVTSSVTNRPIEIVQGTYNIEIMSSPKQEKKNVNLSSGKEEIVEFMVETPKVPEKVKQAAPAAPKAKK